MSDPANLVVDELVAYLASLDLGTPMVDLWAAVLPEQDPAGDGCAGVVQEFQGQPSDQGFGVLGVRFETPGIQVMYRGKPGDSVTPRLRCERAYRAIAAIQPGPLLPGTVDTEYLIALPQGAPSPLKVDDAGRHYYVVNFLIQKELSV